MVGAFRVCWGGYASALHTGCALHTVVSGRLVLMGGEHLPAAPCHAAPCCADVLRSRCAALQVWKVEEGEPEYAALVFYDEITRGESFLCECLVWLCRDARQACLLASCCHDGQEEEENGRGACPGPGLWRCAASCASPAAGRLSSLRLTYFINRLCVASFYLLVNAGPLSLPA